MAIFKHSDSPPLLPLSRGHPSTGPARPLRSATRRLSYHLKNRAGKHAYALAIGAAVAFVFLFYAFTESSSTSVLPYSSRSTNNDKLHSYNRDRKVAQPNADYNGISLLLEDEDELIAEDGLWVDTYVEPEHIPEVIDHDAIEREERRQDVLKHDRLYSLSALLYFLAEGGILPHDFKVPGADTLEKLGGRGFENLLNTADRGEDGDFIFSPGWRDYASRQYRIVVFSKTYCPFSKRAKNILSKYMLTPGPFVIELDRRSDMDKLQALLYRLTGRRTVPNILLDFESIGGADELQMLDGEGVLRKRFGQMGVLPGFKRRFSPARANNLAPPAAPAAPPPADKPAHHAAVALPGRVPAQIPHREIPGQAPKVDADGQAALGRQQQGLVGKQPVEQGVNALEGHVPALNVQGADRVVQGVAMPADGGDDDDEDDEWEKDQAYLERLRVQAGGREAEGVDRPASQETVEEVQEADEDTTGEAPEDESRVAGGNAGKLVEKVQLMAQQAKAKNPMGRGRRGRGRVIG